MRPLSAIFLTIIFIKWVGQPFIINDFIFDRITHDCTVIKDSLTKKIVYTSVDKEAENEGGTVALIKKFQNIKLDNVSDESETTFLIAIIVESDGTISGERVIKDKTGSIGRQMIELVKSLKWIPAECHGKKVPTIKKIPLQIEIKQENN